MIDEPIGQDRTERELLSYDVADEVLEGAALTENAAGFTLGHCTGLSDCPA